MTRLPPLLGRLSRNERSEREAAVRVADFARAKRYEGERDKIIRLQAGIADELARPLSVESVMLTVAEKAEIRRWIPYARGKL